MRRLIMLALSVLLLNSCTIEKLYQMRQRTKVNVYEQIDFHELVKRYMYRQDGEAGQMEGIYSVSLIVIKHGKGFLSSSEKERITDRKENYMQVALIRDLEHPKREYIEVSLDKKYLPSYSIRGEFTRMADANILIYKELDKRGRGDAYTFTSDQSRDILEGIRKENNGNSETTYKLTYLRLHPKKPTALIKK